MYVLVSFILAMNVFEFLFITLPYVLGFLYLVLQLLDLYFRILHIVYLSRIRCSVQLLAYLELTDMLLLSKKQFGNTQI